MAFTKQPVNSTYSTKTVGLLKELGSRGISTAKDSYWLNAYGEIQKNKATQENEVVVQKRPGSSTPVASVGSGGVRGMWLWKDLGRIYIAIGADIYVYSANNPLILVASLIGVFGTTSGDVGFEEFLYSTATTKLVATDGTTLVTIDSANVVVASVGQPVHQPYPVFLDGYLFVVKTNSSSIYNSDLDNPLTWVGGDFIDAEMRPDQINRIASLSNYIVAFGSKTIEYFYDAANASGSPLSRNDSPMKQVGYIGGFAKIAGKVFFVGEEAESAPSVWMLEDFKITEVGVEAIDRHLEGNDPTVYGAIVSFNGHDFYVFSTSAATYALDIGNKLWGRWSYKSGNTFPITYSVFRTSSTNFSKCYFVTNIDQSLNVFDNLLFQDSATSFPVQVVTDNEYFDSYNRKSCNRLTIYGDRVNADILVQTSDDDYQTWSTGQTINLNQEMPCKYRWGMFRRRAHKLSYTGNAQIRLFKIELDVNLGNS